MGNRLTAVFTMDYMTSEEMPVYFMLTLSTAAAMIGVMFFREPRIR
ncbi:MAG: hypothetical protein QXU99_01670 [Candidatus Bathyarchaeia archaeon]